MPNWQAKVLVWAATVKALWASVVPVPSPSQKRFGDSRVHQHMWVLFFRPEVQPKRHGRTLCVSKACVSSCLALPLPPNQLSPLPQKGSVFYKCSKTVPDIGLNVKNIPYSGSSLSLSFSYLSLTHTHFHALSTKSRVIIMHLRQWNFYTLNHSPSSHWPLTHSHTYTHTYIHITHTPHMPLTANGLAPCAANSLSRT